MNTPRKLKAIFKFFPPLLFGLIAFTFITGGNILSPTYVDWLMDGDPATHWLGWEFFRNSPSFQWPLGANPNYGMEIGSSVVFTDSIPLLAFIFKPLNRILPNVFQYIGLWVLLCFLLQSFFSWKLLSLFTKNEWLPLIGSVFFTIAPACLWRLHGHYALFGQWTIVVALYLYFSNRFSFFKWLILLCAAALIHAYLLAMVSVIWIADLVQRKFLNEMSNVVAAKYFFIGLLCIALTMLSSGYFMLNGGIESDGFGFYRMNILSLIDPHDKWSKLLPNQSTGGGDYEGFNYLGVGMIGLVIIAICTLFTGAKFSLPPNKIMPIIIIFVCLFFYAISNHIAFGHHQIFSYNIPSAAKYITNTFRSSGRFFWPAYYILYLAIFYLIFTRLKPIFAIVACTGMLLLQVIDSGDIYGFFRKKFISAPIYKTSMQSPLWEDVATRYKKIIYVLPRNIPENWMSLSYFAARHRMKINIGYFARVDPKKVDEERSLLTELILKGGLDPNSVYVFEDDKLWEFAQSHLSENDIAGHLDGFRIVAPSLKECNHCDLRSITRVN